jgi:hypothetical protein
LGLTKGNDDEPEPRWDQWAIVRLLTVVFFNTRSRTVAETERRMTRE